MITRRREERIAVSLPVRVWGMDASQKPFTQAATVLDLTRAGVRLGGLERQLSAGEIMGIQHGTEKARFRVVWAGKRGGPQQGQAGLICLDAGKYIWGTPLQRLAVLTKPPLGPREQLGTPQAIPPPTPPPAATVTTPAEEEPEKRAKARFAVTGGAEISSSDGSKAWGVLTDIGSSGCYVEMTVPMRAGVPLQVSLSVHGYEIHCDAEVRNSTAGVGMGLLFTRVSAEDRYRLNELLARLATPLNAPAASPLQSKTQSATAAAPDPRSAALADHMRKIASELRSTEDTIASIGLNFDDRVLREFRRILDHARENTRSLQQWLENGADQKSQYKLLDEMEVRRIRLAIEIVRELAIDVDANALHIATEGVADLANAIEQLNGRLMAMRGGSQIG
jgi:hypothetical protein